MKKLRRLLSGTRIDRHGEQMSLGALRSMIETVRRGYIPAGIEHDPRVPPQGRVVSAQLVETSDGQHELVGEIEVFEPGDSIPYAEGDREVVINHIVGESLQLISDRSYRNPASQRELQDLATLLHAELHEEVKKAFEPLSVLTIAAAFVLGGIATGLLNKIGEDLWQSFKAHLKAIFGRSTQPQRERLLSFKFSVRDADRFVMVETVLTNPSPVEIDTFLERGLRLLDRIVPTYVTANPLMVKLVLEFDGERVRVLYGVRRDGAPLTFESTVEESDP